MRYVIGVGLGGTSRFVGERGWLDIARNKMSASSPDLLREMQAPSGKVQLELSNNHHDNFFSCVRSRRKPIADVEIGHRSATACHLGNIALRLKRKIRWDAAKEQMIDDSEAAAMVGRPYREPWKIHSVS